MHGPANIKFAHFSVQSNQAGPTVTEKLLPSYNCTCWDSVVTEITVSSVESERRKMSDIVVEKY